MAVMGQDLWAYNFARVVVVDVSDDYRLMQPPLPSECYPVLAEMWIPAYNLDASISESCLVPGYLYDWHERPRSEADSWIVGVVDGDILRGKPLGQT